MRGYEFDQRRMHAIVTLDLQYAFIHIGLGDFVEPAGIMALPA
jgi:hypothetical protein